MKRIMLFAAFSLLVLVASADELRCQDECQNVNDPCRPIVHLSGVCKYENNCDPVSGSNCPLICKERFGYR